MIEFFEGCLVHVKGPKGGEPLVLERWQKAILQNIFGWKRADGTRRYREAFIYVPRKNGKTILAAGIALYMFLADGEAGAEVYAAAAETDQAALLYDVAKQQIIRTPEWRAAVQPYNSTKTMFIERSASRFKALSSDPDSKWGFNAHCVVIDELHAMRGPRDPELVEALTTSVGARDQPLIVYITTADYAGESVCNTKYEYASKVRDGKDDPYFLPVIYEAHREDDWRKSETWRKANPNLGISVKLDYFEAACRRAMEIPTEENTFKRFHLNIITEQDLRWLPIEKWDLGARAVDLEALRGRECFGGLDLAATTDLAAFVLVFPGSDGVCTTVPNFWIPREGARAHQRKDRLPYEAWMDQGLLEVTPGKVIDYAAIRRKINELGQIYRIREIAVDRWNAAQIITELSGDGFTMVPFGQGYASMSGPSKELERLVIDERLVHGGHPVLREMALSVSVEMDAAGNIKPSREKSSQKIDGIVALVMALGRAIASPAPVEVEAPIWIRH